MTAAGCMNEWQIRFLQSEIKKETNGLSLVQVFFLFEARLKIFFLN